MYVYVRVSYVCVYKGNASVFVITISKVYKKKKNSNALGRH